MSDLRGFPLLSPMLGTEGQPYDTFHLRRLHHAADVLTRWGGTDITHVFKNGWREPPSGVWETDRMRPLISSGRYSTVMAIPVYISEGLSKIHFVSDLCVGLGGAEVPTGSHEPSQVIGPASYITVRYELASDPSRPNYSILFGQQSGGRWRFQRVESSLDVSWAHPGWDILLVSFQSRIPEQYTDPEQWWTGATPALGFPSGVVDHASFETLRPEMISTISSGAISGSPLYQAGPPYPSGRMVLQKNDVTASVLVGTGGAAQYGTPRYIQVLDHLAGDAGSGYDIWIRTPIEEPGRYRRVAKVLVPWVAWRSIAIKEEFSPLDYTVVDSLRSRQPSSAASYRALRRALKKSANRPRMIWTGSPGVYPMSLDESQWWGEQGYHLLDVPSSPEWEYRIPVGRVGSYGPAEKKLVARLIVSGIYWGVKTSQMEPVVPEYGTYDDALDEGVEADVLIAGEKKRIRFSAAGTSKDHPYLLQKLLQLEISSGPQDMSSGGIRAVYGEGLLDREGDIGSWQVIEVPLETVEDLNIEWLAETESGISWISGEQDHLAGRIENGRWVPIYERCWVFVLGYSIYEVPK